MHRTREDGRERVSYDDTIRDAVREYFLDLQWTPSLDRGHVEVFARERDGTRADVRVICPGGETL